MAGSIEFTPPYQDGWQDNEEGATPITADILNNNYDAFLLLLNTWIGNIEDELVAVPDFQISSPSSGQVLKFNGTKWVNAAESSGGSDVSWNQIVQTGTQIASITINGTSYAVYAPSGGSGGASSLNELSDVTLANLANGQVLQYNSNTSKWENKSISVGDSVEFTQILSSGVKIGTITIDGTDYDIYAPQGGGGGTTVIANPSGAATDELEKLQVGSTIYSIPSGGSGGGSGFSKTTLYAISGTTPESVITLSQSLENFDLIEVVSLYGHSDEEDYKNTTMFNAEELVNSIGSARPKNWWVGNDTVYVWFYVTDVDEFTIHTQTGQTGLGIWYVYGYKFEGGGGGSASWKDITGTLTSGQTEITLADPAINAASTLEPFTDKFGVNPTDMELVPGAESVLQPLVESESELLGTVTVSSTFASYSPWKAFTSAGSWVAEGNIDQWIAYEFPANVIVSKVQWFCDDTSRRGTVTNIQYSNDGTTWNDCTLSKNERGDVEISSVNSAKYWRLFFAAPFGSWTEPMIGGLEFIAVVNGVKLTFPVQSENLNVKVRVS